MFCSKTREDGNKQTKIIFYYNICFVMSLFQHYSEEMRFPPGPIKFFLAFLPCLHHYTQEWHPMIHPLGAVKPERHTYLPDVSSPAFPNGLNPPMSKAFGVCAQYDAAVTTGKPLQNIWCVCPWRHSAEQKHWNNKISALMPPSSRFSSNSD